MDVPSGFFLSAHQQLVKALCAAANHLLAAEPQAREKLAAHRGKTLRLEARALPALALSVQQDDMLAPPADDDAQATLTLHIDMAKAAGLAVQGKDLAGAVGIQGDAEFAAALGWLAANLRWEFEDDLEKLFGPAAAHYMGKQVRAVGEAMRKTADDAESMIKRGLNESGAPLVNDANFAPLQQAVTQLRDAVARLDKRLELLERSAAKTTPSSYQDKVTAG